MNRSHNEFSSSAYWQDKALSLAIETRLFINGEYTAAAENETFETVDPVTQAPLAKIARGKSVDIDRAVSAARGVLNAATGHSLLRLNVKRY
ncbi:gamma-glutamyl-gamma-aminobutyraldehyde dehydrogenase [Escherichia coli]|uniref:Gamma-glutamyl-gamma-aminobutyraldehyde dehydrogenase n=1 Tax=Escherichia coli TaxID=562 RepID=A0A376MWI1_ECOLX|nr:gamma-glutamyl-gamma-aminobutyraldehyde dehydrogenase [Escherichia coli]